MTPVRSTLVLLLLALLVPCQVDAQLPGDLSPATVRATAMGGANVLQRPTPGAAASNPALSGDASGADLGWAWSGDDATRAWTAFEGGGFVFGLRHQSQNDAPTDLALSMSGSRSLFGFDVGVGLALAERSRWVHRDRAIYLNAGVVREVAEFRLAASVLGVGTGTSSPSPTDPNGDEIFVGLPSTPVFLIQGASNSFQVGPLDAILAGRVQIADGQSSAGGGLELGYWPVTGRTFRLLAGYGRNPVSGETRPTWGASFSGDAITVEFASFSESGNGTHTLGLRWR